MATPPSARLNGPTTLAALVACVLASGGCERKADDRHARADLEKARTRITAAMDRIAQQEAAARVVVVIHSVGERADEVASALAEARGLSLEDARAFLAAPEGVDPVALSRPTARDEAETLLAALTRAGARASIQAPPSDEQTDADPATEPTESPEPHP